jgi:exonuclease SbcC
MNSISSSIEEAGTLEEKYKAYEYYLTSIKRNGIPYELISNALPYLEEEVNSILSQMVEFNIKFETDGKNINTIIDYGTAGNWSLNLTSGMEKFISSLAIRVSLISLTNLPRPNFIAIDEGFGNLDPENINSMNTLFNYLKNYFDFILIISHIDTMKDTTEDLIEINKIGDYSLVNY